MRVRTDCKYCSAYWYDMAEKTVCSKCAGREPLLETVATKIRTVADFDILVDILSSEIIGGGYKLTDGEIRGLCDVYFNINRTPEQLTRASQLYQELDHSNSMVNMGEGVRLAYV